MKWRLVAVGRNSHQDDYARLADDYLKKASDLSRPFGLERIPVISVAQSRAKTAEKRKQDEAKAIKSACGKAFIIALDEHGALLSSIAFSEKLQSYIISRRDVAFVIGGADGLDPSIKQVADTTLALGRITLPHRLVRLILAEQIYRGFSINQNHPYHRE